MLSFNDTLIHFVLSDNICETYPMIRIRTPEKLTIDILSGNVMVCLVFKEEYSSFVSHLNRVLGDRGVAYQAQDTEFESQHSTHVCLHIYTSKHSVV